MQRCPKTIWLAVLAFVFVLGPFMGQASAQQDNSTPAPSNPPVSNPPVDVAKAQPSSPDTPPQRVAPVKLDSYVIGAEDILSINVWKEQELSRQVPVRPDGMISL